MIASIASREPAVAASVAYAKFYKPAPRDLSATRAQASAAADEVRPITLMVATQVGAALSAVVVYRATAVNPSAGSASAGQAYADQLNDAGEDAHLERGLAYLETIASLDTP